MAKTVYLRRLGSRTCRKNMSLPLAHTEPESKVGHAAEDGPLRREQTQPQQRTTHEVEGRHVAHAPAADERSERAHDEAEVVVLRQPGEATDTLSGGETSQLECLFFFFFLCFEATRAARAKRQRISQAGTGRGGGGRC